MKKIEFAGVRYLAVLFLSLFFAFPVSAQIAPEDLKTQIYPYLKDRRCAMPLNECDCPDAREMKAYVEALAEGGISKEDIFYKTAKKFSLNALLNQEIKSRVSERMIGEAGVNRPSFSLEPASFDFGQVKKSQGKISQVFTIFNKGKGTLILSNVKVSCGCVSAVLPSAKGKKELAVAPGRKDKLEVVVDLNHQSVSVGKLLREVYLSTNDILNKEVVITLKAEVED